MVAHTKGRGVRIASSIHVTKGVGPNPVLVCLGRADEAGEGCFDLWILESVSWDI
jgi:hypothetical protein